MQDHSAAQLKQCTNWTLKHSLLNENLQLVIDQSSYNCYAFVSKSHDFSYTVSRGLSCHLYSQGRLISSRIPGLKSLEMSQNLMQHKAEVDEIILFRLYTDLIFHNYP